MYEENSNLNSPPYDARAVANLILDLASLRKVKITQMQLLKILYFCNGWYLAANGTRLVDQDFQAWKYGPVIKIIADEFKRFGRDPITTRAERFDIFTGEILPVHPVSKKGDVDFIENIFEAYHIHDGWKLSEMTHERGSPWDRVWNSDRPIGRLGLRINEDDIKEHFQNLKRRFGVN